jgi:hypothetical protein
VMFSVTIKSRITALSVEVTHLLGRAKRRELIARRFIPWLRR